VDLPAGPIPGEPDAVADVLAVALVEQLDQQLAGAQGTRVATLDYWDDPTDVYPVDLVGRGRLSISVAGAAGTSARLRLWSPQTRSVFGAASKLEVARSTTVGAKQRLSYLVPPGGSGRYYVQLSMTRAGSGTYTLRWAKR